MAVNFKLPDLLTGLLPGERLLNAPALREPVSVRFRRGANLEKVSDEILNESHVRILAAVGAGKSSLLPPALAVRAKKLVVFVTGNPLLALATFQYAQKRASSGVLMPPINRYNSKIEDSMPRTGVLYCGANEYVSLALRFTAAGKKLPDHVVFLDEAHFCDAWTYVVRRLSRELGASLLVEASATFEPDSNIMRETDGAVKVVTYMADGSKPTEWQVDDKNKPWSYATVNNNIVIFTDSRTEAKHLVSQYEMQGFKPHWLYANMSEVDFNRAMSDLNDKKGALVAIIADSTFRNGFTFNASRCVDTGRVGYYQYVPGSVVRTSRPLYSLEKIQTCGRFSRVGSNSSTYYCPDQDYPMKICDLLPVEMEAAAYVFRLLGFKPTGELAGAVMAEEFLPFGTDFTVAINALYPLQHYVMNAKGERRPPSPGLPDSKRFAVPARGAGENRERRPSDRSDSSVATFSSGKTSGTNETKASSRSDHSAEDFFHKIGQSKPKATEVNEGDYCVVSGLPKAESCKVQFPRGIDSVAKYMRPDLDASGLRSAASMFGDKARDEALVLVLRDYNADNAAIRAMARALSAAHQAGLGDGAGPRYWTLMAEMSEDYTGRKLHRAVNLARIASLSDGRHRVDVIGDPIDAENELAEDMLRAMEAAAGTRDKKGKPEVALQDTARTLSYRPYRDEGSRPKIAGSRGSVRTREYGELGWWTGCSGKEVIRKDDGSLESTTYTTNVLGRVLTGRTSVRVTENHVVSRTTTGAKIIQKI